jgi:DNA-binding PadR family transcriptional regulator
MPLPDLTTLQFAVLLVLGGVERSGREIRSKLAEQGVSKTLAAFYQLMARMEDAKLVEGSYHKAEVAGQPVQERWYKITGAGIRAYNEAQSFYRNAPSLGRKGACAQ